METPSPHPFNSGASIHDAIAVGPDAQSIAAWRAKNNIDVARQVRTVKLAHMRYQHPDLDRITQFLHDFGMDLVKRTDTEVWFRGSGPDPYVYYARTGERKFLGGTFLVESWDDLVKASKMETAGEIVPLSDAPGGGSMVTVLDPEGHPINFIHGQEPAETVPAQEKLIVNYPEEKPRQKKFNRFAEGPAAVYKLGHYGLCVNDFPRQMQWYTQNFNFVPSDLLYVDDATDSSSRRDVAIFAHIDRGATLVDHHTIFLSQSTSSHVHHASFEVHDVDSQQLGHRWLAARGYESVWGVGRHVLGSQIFDYWWDPTGNMIEHYADGDLVDGDTAVGHGPAGDESLAVWGPEVPKWFLD